MNFGVRKLELCGYQLLKKLTSFRLLTQYRRVTDEQIYRQAHTLLSQRPALA